MGKDNTILTVDIGSRSLKMAEFLLQDGNMMLTKFLSRRVEQLENEPVAACFERNYNEMLLEGGFSAKEVRLALPSSNSFQRLSKLPAMIGNTATIGKIIEFEASQAVPYSMHEIEWGYQLLHHEWEETVEEENENGEVEKVSVKNEEYEALFVAVKNEDVTCYTDAIERSGKKLISVELSALTLFNAAVVSRINEDECAMILEIGAKGTCLMIADHRRIFMRNIPIGGDTVNAQISREFGVGDSEAEDMKRHHGFIALGGAYEEPSSNLASTISKIARNVMTRLHGEVSRSINVWRAQHNGNAPTKVLLAGGGSAMQYTVEFFNEKLRLPVEYLNSFNLINIAPTVNRDQLQASASMAQAMIGMALHSLGSCPVDISLLPREIRKQYILDARKPYFYASAVALISCLLISVVGIGEVRNFEQQRVEKVEADVKKAEAEVASVNSFKGTLDSHKSNYDQAAKYLDARNLIGSLMENLQAVIPSDRMWLTAFEPYVPAGGADSYNEMGEPVAAAAAEWKRLTPEQFNAITEVKQLRLNGYVIRVDKLDKTSDRNLLIEFVEAVKKKPEIFESISYETSVDGNSNLTYFEIIITLKDALKK